jgi:ribonuclease HI
MVSCPLAIRFWKEIRVITRCKLPLLHPDSWTTDLLSTGFCTPEETAVYICGAWSLWTGRNGRKHGNSSWSPIAAAKHVAKMIEDLVCLTHKPLVGTPRSRGVWKRPDLDWRKVNSHGSFDASTFSGTSGAVLRDDVGNLLMAAAKNYAHIPDALTAEALAARDGILLALSGGFDKVILELDNLTLVNFLRSVASERSKIAGLWHEISELSKSFSSFKISFVKREGNEAAQHCAKLLPLSIPECVWTEAFPASLLEKAISDCNLASEFPGDAPPFWSSGCLALSARLWGPLHAPPRRWNRGEGASSRPPSDGGRAPSMLSPPRAASQELGLCPQITSEESRTHLTRSRSHNGPTDPRSKLDQA